MLVPLRYVFGVGADAGSENRRRAHVTLFAHATAAASVHMTATELGKRWMGRCRPGHV